MASSTNPSAVDAAAGAFFQDVEAYVATLPGAYTRHGAQGLRLIASTIPDPTLNGIFHTGQGRDLDQLDAFAQEMSALDMPWSIHVRGEVAPQLARLAARYGRTSTTTLPLLIGNPRLSPTLEPELPDGARVRKLDGTEADVFAEAVAAGFEMPRTLADYFASPALLDAPGMSAFVLEINDEVVTTGFTIQTGDHVGLYTGSTRPQYRRRGYARALVAARLREAVTSGARHAYTQNSPMSRPLYESLGFHVAETWTYLTAGE